MKPVTSWGRLSAEPHHVVALTDRSIEQALSGHGARPALPHGMGRSYGDVCLNPWGTLWLTAGLDHFISFDDATGRLVCEAGALLRDIQRLFVPRGWMLPVTPGTQLVTVGGAIANDVHGKNHHAKGTFGDHIQSLTLWRTDGEIIRCGPSERPEWFAATVGGLGLTGLITQADIQLRRVTGPWLQTETIPYAGLDEFFKLANESQQQNGPDALWEHTVAWVDCTTDSASGGVFVRARPADAPGQDQPESRRPPPGQWTVPFAPPFSLVNRLSLRPFNRVYRYLRQRQSGRHLSHYEPFFYPLDHLLEWNRLYGPKGFYQYQCVVPREVGREAVGAMLKEVARAGDGSFLTVLKTFGQRQAPGMLSFPTPGVTLALDFPNSGERTLKLFERLDAIVSETGGRIYPAKDARMPRALFESGYARLPEFLKYRDPGISSGLSRRLMGS